MKRLLSTALSALLVGTAAILTFAPAAVADIVIVAPRNSRRFQRFSPSRFDSHFSRRGVSRRFVRGRVYSPRGRVFIRSGRVGRSSRFRRFSHRPFRHSSRRSFRRY